MLRATRTIRPAVDPIDVITLDQELRCKRRFKLVSDSGVEFLLDLPKTPFLKHGDGVILEDGRIIEIHAALEKLVRVSGDNSTHLLQLAWQLGNRHQPAEIHPEYILVRRDPIIEEMIRLLGGNLTHIEASFDPERGAYHVDP